ncbi:hypothetical protein ABTX15_15305 [Micromonospora sp. NPDC094482]|uniref:hypothetical protein n=1 Tax=unclassified Micromonospora TaxID=2617518 RepID=UPI0033345167
MPWIVVLLGVATLATIMLVASLSFRGREPKPVAASVPPLALPIPPAEPSPSATGSPSPSRSRVTASARPSRSATRSAPATTPASPPPSSPATGQPLVGTGALTATYRVRDADRDDVEAELLVENQSGRAEEWTVSFTFTGRVWGVRVSGGSWPMLIYRGDNRYELRGTDPLQDGGSIELEVQFSRRDSDDGLTGCTVNGSACTLA